MIFFDVLVAFQIGAISCNIICEICRQWARIFLTEGGQSTELTSQQHWSHQTRSIAVIWGNGRMSSNWDWWSVISACVITNHQLAIDHDHAAAETCKRICLVRAVGACHAYHAYCILYIITHCFVTYMRWSCDGSKVPLEFSRDPFCSQIAKHCCVKRYIACFRLECSRKIHAMHVCSMYVQEGNL